MRVSEVHAAESVAYLHRALIRLQDIWENIGIPEEQRLERTNDVHEHIKSLLDLMVVEEEALEKRLLRNIDSYTQELDVLCRELQLPPFEEGEGWSVLQREKNSRTRLEVMKEHKKQRMEELKSLVVRDRDLCDILCSEAFSVDQQVTPSLKQLEAFRSHLDLLSHEKDRRHQEFVSVKREIVSCMKELEQEPESSFEVAATCEDHDAFCLSTDNIQALKTLLAQLKDRRAEKELHCSALRTKVQELWERLKVPQDERDIVSVHMVDSKRKNVEALQQEVERLQALKMLSMKSVVGSIRAEISVLWERCFYSQEQQQKFVPYVDDDFTEELLELHEAEVEALKTHFQEHKDLFDGVRKWQNNWMVYLDLDRKANDPGRFNNRGGNLLKEGKQRNDLAKSLPKLEKVLKAQMDAWEQQHGREFLIHGQKFLQYVQLQWQQHHADKEKEKLERQMKKSKMIQEEMLYGTVKTPTKRRLAGTPTPVKVRRLNSIVSTPDSLAGTSCRRPASTSKSLRTPGHKTLRALDRNKENISHLLRNPAPQDHTFSIDSYSEFARDLTKASGAVTSVLNSTVTRP